ncbi:hypothetical protein N656DRAFT_465349 [Canariomyces notabilis]|uniref:Uncharacterized protein n=1 Tax=Canariomyces notabilis TaxID=2074819 RepID=A0AAN6QIA4_9PEZI|nr:hypothetical protein N656DRAFT_465349 [Canariomyces arenarius]
MQQRRVNACKTAEVPQLKHRKLVQVLEACSAKPPITRFMLVTTKSSTSDRRSALATGLPQRNSPYPAQPGRAARRHDSKRAARQQLLLADAPLLHGSYGRGLYAGNFKPRASCRIPTFGSTNRTAPRPGRLEAHQECAHMRSYSVYPPIEGISYISLSGSQKTLTSILVFNVPVLVIATA